MTDDVPSLGQVELNWQPGKLREAGEVMRAQSEDFLNLTDQMVSHIREVGATWEGDAYWAAYDRIAGDRDNGNRIASEVGNLAQLLISSGDSISSYRGVLLGAVASARESGFRVTERWTVEAAVATADDLGQVLSEHQSAISTAVNEMLSAQSDAVSAIEQASREVRAEGDRLGAGDDPTADRAEEEARAAAAAAAFAEIFGRPPVSLTDWETARVLDPNSYDPKYRGVDPEIRVARIDPVTGRGWFGCRST
ncbi:hypothetical protein G4H71_08940 [Rhodococcus triatomae]|uniref:WXG100 family type VII secretion target n=1 Tax=Rhodococcus triatomae TaxID=300028 RepID=UPI0011135072|nr:hypothetical protein [Rhodococcus triatomae]QNG20944.1 hypothetical protein G4H72_21445 [Rhodococcus triatomae]QNG23141.1 hypothetical protein G4H71_08940 [Rhodococcus triatomae]